MRIKAKVIAARAAELADHVTHEVTLYTDAKAKSERFAICDRGGKPVWYGLFFDGEGAEQSDAELEAAKKAVWLAGKVREVLGATVLRLNLLTDAEWLKWQTSPKQKGFVLTQLARTRDVELHVRWVAGKSNPADPYTTCSGFKKWQDNDLAALATELTPEQNIETVGAAAGSDGGA